MSDGTHFPRRRQRVYDLVKIKVDDVPNTNVSVALTGRNTAQSVKTFQYSGYCCAQAIMSAFSVASIWSLTERNILFQRVGESPVVSCDVA